MVKEYRWATLGCGVIAHELARAMEKQGRKLYAVANRTREKAEAFAKEYGIEKVYSRLEDVFEDPAVDVIYISTPHNTHLPFLLQALSRKKHVLCEKAITLNSHELELAMRSARENDVVLAEAMTVYHMPLYRELEQRIRGGELGPLRMIQMNFGSYKEYDMTNRFFNRNLAGGALLDIGVYALSFARWFLSSQPDQVVSQVRLAPTGVDEQAGILLMNPQQEMVTIALSLHAKQPKRGMAAFDRGYLEVYNYPRAEEAVITYTQDGLQQIIRSGSTADALSYEVLDMEHTISTGEDRMRLNYTKDVMDLMTRIRRDWKLTYPEEESGR